MQTVQEMLVIQQAHMGPGYMPPVHAWTKLQPWLDAVLLARF